MVPTSAAGGDRVQVSGLGANSPTWVLLGLLHPQDPALEKLLGWDFPTQQGRE